MSSADVLRAAAEIVGKGWTTVGAAEDAAGNTIPLYGGTLGDTARAGINPAAVKFSMYGAIVKAMYDSPPPEGMNLAWKVLADTIIDRGAVTGGTNHLHPILLFNAAPDRTAAEVQALLLEVADLMEGKST